MATEISAEVASDLISRNLVGYSIDRISYYITGWELRLNSPSGPELQLSAAEIVAGDIEAMWGGLGELPIDLHNTNEPNDTLIAMILFTATNKWPITGASVDIPGNLIITFGNQSSIRCLAKVEQTDWTWDIRDLDDRNCMTCDSGPIFMQGDVFHGR
jgi:hypothetical protein